MLFNKSIEEIKDLPMFFIVGRPRSGTTLLQQILDANPEVIIPLEARFITLLKARYYKKTDWTDSDIIEFVDSLYKDLQFAKYWGVEKNKLLSLFQSLPKSEINYILLCKLVYLSYATIYEKANIRIIGDKKPLNSIFVPEIMELFPEAKFIHIVRDYRANILSIKQWFALQSVFELAKAWELKNKFIDKFKNLNSSKFYTIRYEDLVDDSEKYAREISVFLGITYLPQMLEFHKKINEEFDKSKESAKEEDRMELLNSLHNNLLKPINKEKVDSWRTALTQKEIHIADYVAGEYASKYGYSKIYKDGSFYLWLNSIWAGFKVRMGDLIIKVYHKTPNWIRKITRSVSWLLYKLFGFTHVFNPDFREEMRKKKNVK